MENAICLDTDILIDILRNKKEAVEWLEKNQEKELKTTIINVFELYAGVYRSTNRKDARKSVIALLESLVIINFDEESSEEAGRIHALSEEKGHIIDNRDIFIGVIAKMSNCELKTNNKKHFERIEGLNLAD